MTALRYWAGDRLIDLTEWTATWAPYWLFRATIWLEQRLDWSAE